MTGFEKTLTLGYTGTPQRGQLFSTKLYKHHQVSEHWQSDHFWGHFITFENWPFYGLDPLELFACCVWLFCL
jgi:hypothetical protein